MAIEKFLDGPEEKECVEEFDQEFALFEYMDDNEEDPIE